MRYNFFDYQYSMLDPLKVWGLINMALGWSGALSTDPLLRHIGFQAMGWGVIDATLALFGQHSANCKAEIARRGKMPRDRMRHEVRSFRRLLLINAGLDVGYVLGGLWLLLTAGERRERRGMGLGILIQSLFLLCYDAALAQDVKHRWG